MPPYAHDRHSILIHIHTWSVSSSLFTYSQPFLLIERGDAGNRLEFFKLQVPQD